MTYSIIARDPRTRQIGIAVQSHFLACGPIVCWAKPGVGAVASQALAEIAYGPKGLHLMEAGFSAQQSLSKLVEQDEMSSVRQLAFIDSKGGVAAHTGELCIGQAGHSIGDQVSVQANLMEKDSVWPAMLEAYTSSEGLPLGERLIKALIAAEGEGGDVRGQQAAALKIVNDDASPLPWGDYVVDLRVDNSDQPLAELQQLYEHDVAFRNLKEVLDSGVLLAPTVDQHSPAVISALAKLDLAQASSKTNREPSFWRAVLLAKLDLVDEAKASLSYAEETNPRWRLLVGALVRQGLLSSDNPLLVDRPDVLSKS